MSQIETIYLQILSNFPETFRPLVSVALAVLLVYSIFKVVKKDFIFIIVLIVLLPSSVPILKSVWQGLVELVQFMLHAK